ncbi:hypothetical protein [Tranquillimonas alkanivorans]|uniref:Uncharacterized protein n=1 Tax=Tranquillimonas alkanivorans TaxID=441119 RepID=A0A1I5VBC1_9RHOB|nr:hypothetical protein [Tranquillimonas alkanivorans]SFQ04854.1 hypothetical protein SAMN04488047_1297 [Tranquillimonas alkanivorans]
MQHMQKPTTIDTVIEPDVSSVVAPSPAEKRAAAFLAQHGDALVRLLSAIAGPEGRAAAAHLRKQPSRLRFQEAAELLAAAPVAARPGDEPDLDAATRFFGARLSDLAAELA